MVSRDLGGLISGGTITSHRTALRRNSTFVDLDITLLVGLSEVLGRAVTDMRRYPRKQIVARSHRSRTPNPYAVSDGFQEHRSVYPNSSEAA